MCHNPDPSSTPFYGPKTVHRILACTSALRMCCALVALLSQQRCHEGQYYATYMRRSSRKSLCFLVSYRSPSPLVLHNPGCAIRTIFSGRVSVMQSLALLTVEGAMR